MHLDTAWNTEEREHNLQFMESARSLSSFEQKIISTIRTADGNMARNDTIMDDIITM